MSLENSIPIKYNNLKFRLNYTVDKEGNIYTPWREWHQMYQHSNKAGYKELYLYLEDGRRKCFKVHRIVMNTFSPAEDSENLQVNHINGIKYDNRLENLEWVTRSENLLHVFRTGLEEKPKGEKNPNHKLTEKEVILICEKLKKGATLMSLAIEFGVSKSTISAIKNKRVWKNITEKFFN